MVFGRGLGIKQLFVKFMTAYCVAPDSSVMPSERRLVFCLNTTGQEESLRNAVLLEGVSPSRLPVIISNKTNTQTRRMMYAEG